MNKTTRICTACNAYHPLSEFDPASPDFPTRDGLQFNCRKSVSERGWPKYRRLPNGRVEVVHHDDMRLQEQENAELQSSREYMSGDL